VEDNSNWNRRIKLPEIGDKNLLSYDPIIGVVKYTKENTKICDKGCELYLQIKSEEMTNKETEFTEVSFSMTTKSSDTKNYIKMRLDEYVKGNIDKGEYKYYTIVIPKEYLKLSFNLYSPYGKAYIKLGTEVTNIKEEHDWELTPTNKFGRVVISSSDEKIKKDSLKGFSLIVAISTIENLPDGDLSDYLYYYLEIQTLYNNEKVYYHLTSERSIICNTENDNYCHVLILKNQYESENYHLSIEPLLKENNFSYKVIKKMRSEVEEKSLKDSIQEFFSKEEDSYEDPKLRAEIKTTNDYYLFITVFGSKKNNLFKLILTGNDVSQTLLPYNTERYINVNQGKIDFLLPSNDKTKLKYVVNIKSLKGNNNILNINDNKYNLSGNSYFEIEANFNEKAFYLENELEKEINVLINYEKKSSNKIYELDLNNKNEINIPFKEEDLPQRIYTKLEKPIQIGVLFHDIEYKEYKNEDLFDVNAYIIDDKTLDSLKISPKNEITGEKVEGFLLKYEKSGIINVPFDKIKDDQICYLYTVVEKNQKNQNLYNNVKLQYSILKREEEVEMNIYPKLYYYSSLEEPSTNDYYYLQKASKNDSHIVIDISENMPVYNNFYFIVNSPKENNEIDKQIIDYNGRKRIIVNVAEDDGVYLWINKNYFGDNKTKNYSLVYYSVNDLNSFDNYSDFNNSIVINKKKDVSALVINNIKKDYDFIKEVTYYIDVIQKKNDTKFNQEIDTIYLGNRDEDLIKSSKTLKRDEKLIHINLDYNKNDTLTNYSVRLIAEIVKNDGSKDKYMYNSTLLDFGGEEKSDEESDKINNEKSYLWLYILIPILVLLIVIVIVLLIIKTKRKQNSELKILDVDDDDNKVGILLKEKSDEIE
jgi:hypothetical protein